MDYNTVRQGCVSLQAKLRSHNNILYIQKTKGTGKKDKRNDKPNQIVCTGVYWSVMDGFLCLRTRELMLTIPICAHANE